MGENITEEAEKRSYLHEILCCVHLKWDSLLAPVTYLQQKLLAVVVLTSAEYVLPRWHLCRDTFSVMCYTRLIADIMTIEPIIRLL